MGGHGSATLDAGVELASAVCSCVDVAGSRATLAALSGCHVVCVVDLLFVGLVWKLSWSKPGYLESNSMG